MKLTPINWYVVLECSYAWFDVSFSRNSRAFTFFVQSPANSLCSDDFNDCKSATVRLSPLPSRLQFCFSAAVPIQRHEHKFLQNVLLRNYLHRCALLFAVDHRPLRYYRARRGLALVRRRSTDRNRDHDGIYLLLGHYDAVPLLAILSRQETVLRGLGHNANHFL